MTDIYLAVGQGVVAGVIGLTIGAAFWLVIWASAKLGSWLHNRMSITAARNALRKQGWM